MRGSDGEANDWNRRNEAGFSLPFSDTLVSVLALLFSIAELEVWLVGIWVAGPRRWAGGIVWAGGLGFKAMGDSSISMISFPTGVLIRLRSGSLTGDST